MALTRDFTKDQITYIWEVWRLSVNYKSSKYLRMRWTAEKCHEAYPKISKMSFYKFIDSELTVSGT